MSADTSRAAKRQTMRVSLAAVVLGADLTTILGIVPFDSRVVSVKYIPKAAAVGDNTNARTFTLLNKGSAAAAGTTVATLAQTTGVDLAAYIAKDFTLHATLTNRDVVAGDVLAITSVHTGTGVADPGGILEIAFATGSGATD